MSHSVVRIQNDTYIAHSYVVGHILENVETDEPLPVVLSTITSDRNELECLDDQLREFANIDDVYNEIFAEILLVQDLCNTPQINMNEWIINSKHKFSSVYHVQSSDDAKILSSGPYFVQKHNIYQAWRIYPDNLCAFVIPLIPDNSIYPESFSVLPSYNSDGSYQSIAVPSRLYARPSEKYPLAGIRISVKDNISVKGVKTTMMNRAYNDFYPPRTETAEPIKQLIEQGAVIVGKTKMISFAASETSKEWLDYQYPYSARADGYQISSGSSTGAGAALTGYSWLDCSLGTDFAGSTRNPASRCGLYGLRPTSGVGDISGIVGGSESFDTIGILARDIDISCNMAISIMKLKEKKIQLPRRIILPLDFFPLADSVHQKMVDEFITILEQYLGITKIELKLADVWAEDPPGEAKGMNLAEYLDCNVRNVSFYETYHAFDNFRRDHSAIKGHSPYVSLHIQNRWKCAKDCTKNDHDQGLKEMAVFRSWFQKKIFQSDEGSDDLSTVILMPFGTATPCYRDTEEPYNAPGFPTLSTNFLSPILKIPHFVFPIGQRPYESRVTQRTEYTPVPCSIMGPRGSDLALMRLVQSVMRQAEWPTIIKTGRYTFDLGDNSRHTAYSVASHQA